MLRKSERLGWPWGKRASAWRSHVIASSKPSILSNCLKRVDMALARPLRQNEWSGWPWVWEEMLDGNVWCLLQVLHSLQLLKASGHGLGEVTERRWMLRMSMRSENKCCDRFLHSSQLLIAVAKLPRIFQWIGCPIGQRLNVERSMFNPWLLQVIDSSKYSIPPRCWKRS